ncbi:MAG TPA: DUF1775 domain-containing protein [Gaiellaceae bacterium]|nr:DUF1775 domain-containing protein [Gaiellaceae bacterium]
MRKTFGVATLLGLVVTPVAAAHVEPSPEKVPAGSVSRITLSVEGEENVPAVKLTVQMPLVVADVVAHPSRGWKRSVRGRIVEWSGGQIPHGAVGKFSFSAHMPDAPGRTLVLPSLVTYQDGTVVHWIGAESSDTPAPRVKLALSQQANAPPPPTTSVAPTTSTNDAGDGGSDSWIWVVIAVAILASLAAVVIGRRRRA